MVSNPTHSHAQEKRNRKALALYQDGIEALRNRQIPLARQKLEKALEKEPNLPEAHQALADIGRLIRDRDLQSLHLMALAEMRPDSPEAPSLLSFTAERLREVGKYAEAVTLYERALAYPKRMGTPLTGAMTRKLEQGLTSARFAQEAVKNPITLEKKPLPTIINRFPLQYTPSATADDQTLVYTGRKGVASYNDEDIYIAQRGMDGQWQAPKSISPTINTPGNEGTTGLSADGSVLVFTSCERNRAGRCDIYISRRMGDKWTEPKAVDSANSNSWDSHPNLSADGNTLVFVSDRAGGYGKYDIYFAHRWPNGRWSRAVNAGPTINTEEEEIMPYLHPNNRSFFFASRGWPGMGGADLFTAERGDQIAQSSWPASHTRWEQPKNLGYPLNTERDESSIFISPDGHKAYYCVEQQQQGVAISSAIFEFDLGQSLKLPARSYFVKGTVREVGTKKPLKAQAVLTDNARGQTVYQIESDSATGEYLMVLPEGNRYALVVSRRGYLFQSRFFDFDSAKNAGSLQMDFDLEPIKAGAITVLNNVFFQSSKYDLLPESQAELRRVANLMAENPTIRVEIGGHTDDVGADADNLILSQKRARAVQDFLSSQNIPPARLQSRGYGETKPAAKTQTEEDRAKNRRIEFRIL